MKVFAEFITENGIQYRRKTILQFGNSWELIGSAVLKNPGSAQPQEIISNENFEQIRKLYAHHKLLQERWFDFSDDATMRFLEKVFNGYYLNKEFKLNGVIQLFNLHYVRDQDISNARKTVIANNSKYLYQDADEIICLLKNKPLFIGWFNEYNLNSTTKQNAYKIFDYIINSNFNYLKPFMKDNKFYHPMYINISYKKIITQEVVKDFYNLF